MKDNYWRRREGLPRVGRFIKGSDPLIQNLSLTDFSFREICDAAYIETDNIRRSLIRPDLHEESVIDEGIRRSDTIDKELRPPEAIRPLLRPLDFTEDWEKQKARATARRQSRSEDEDEFDVELEMQKQSTRKPKKTKAASLAVDFETKSKGNLDDAAPESSVTESHSPEDTAAPAIKSASNIIRPEEISLQEDNRRRFRAQTETMDQLGKEINRISNSINEKGAAPLQVERPPDTELDAADELPQDNATEAFIPLNQPNHTDQSSIEQAAVERYKNHQAEIQRSYQEELKLAFEEAKASGFTSGYQFGEEKAALQFKAHTQEIAKHLQSALDRIDGLKEGLIKNAEHNFKEALHAIATVLIKKELSIDPQALASVIKQAIAEGIEGDQIKIFVHPDTFDLLTKANQSNLSGKLTRDDQIPVGEFRIESSLSVVDGKVSDLVKDMIAQVDLRLTNKAS
jgi:flagellar biosynthesis/type III secretory pathway protein FliH